jgi:hypothetical protein
LARWIEVTKLIEYMLDKGNVWFAPMEEIARHVKKCMDDGSYVPRVDHLPYYTEKVSVGPPAGSSHKAAE